MPGYWWQCESCGADSDFMEACGSKGIPHFIWDVLLPSKWDQSKLKSECKKCQKDSLRITYEFPRAEKEVIRVVSIVGVGPYNNIYLPMMWETYMVGNEDDRLFDFKYLNGRNVWGLNKAAVFGRQELKELFDLYRS
ncbi:MAG: hypothetical protein Q7W05_11525, partial [Deltaproteobacteria bacterium]|nr:hypothetical protein [Deltaproteobacteria bacterium]